MTDMKRISCSFPDHIVAALDAEKESGKLAGMPYSAIIRYYVALGLEAYAAEGGRRTKRKRPKSADSRASAEA